MAGLEIKVMMAFAFRHDARPKKRDAIRSRPGLALGMDSGQKKWKP